MTVLSAEGSLSVSGITADVIDTTGAGDAFAAAFLSGWLENWPLADAARFGCAAGALATRSIGARSSLPTREETLAAIDHAAAALTPPRSQR